MRLGRLPSELCDALTAAEFFEAQAYLREEPLDPALLSALAEMLAALANGALQRKDKAVWSAADFLPRRWVAEDKPAEPDPMAFAAALRANRAPLRKRW